MGGGSGGGFGSSSPPPPVAKKQKRNAAAAAAAATFSGAARTAGLERTLEEQHAENCAKAAQLWATCTADGDATPNYEGGWEAYPAPDAGVSPDNAPYGTERLLLKSRAPLLSAATCQSLIDQMERHGAANGWDSRYPVTGFTREVNVADIPESVELLNAALESTLLPAAAAEFDEIRASDLRVNEALVVKYACKSPVHIPCASPRESQPPTDICQNSRGYLPCISLHSPCHHLAGVERLAHRISNASVHIASRKICTPNSIADEVPSVRYRYDAASGHNCLPVHQDFSLLTINVALSESSCFTGGGTWFQHNDLTLVANRGECVMHAGESSCSLQLLNSNLMNSRQP